MRLAERSRLWYSTRGFPEKHCQSKTLQTAKCFAEVEELTFRYWVPAPSRRNPMTVLVVTGWLAAYWSSVERMLTRKSIPLVTVVGGIIPSISPICRCVGWAVASICQDAQYDTADSCKTSYTGAREPPSVLVPLDENSSASAKL